MGEVPSHRARLARRHGRRRRALYRRILGRRRKLRTPDYTLFDAMVRYETGPWRFQVNASNLADKRHVTTCLSRGDCFFGIGRTVLGSATYRF
jgi:outer membrane receptor protein involved in Fe transport